MSKLISTPRIVVNSQMATKIRETLICRNTFPVYVNDICQHVYYVNARGSADIVLYSTVGPVNIVLLIALILSVETRRHSPVTLSTLRVSTYRWHCIHYVCLYTGDIIYITRVYIPVTLYTLRVSTYRWHCMHYVCLYTGDIVCITYVYIPVTLYTLRMSIYRWHCIHYACLHTGDIVHITCVYIPGRALNEGQICLRYMQPLSLTTRH
jgi:hypothetical protein